MQRNRRPTRARAFTLVEATIATVIVAVMLVAALQAVGATRLGEQRLARRARALALCQDLLAEIMQRDYLDPDGAAVFGTESGESVATRSGFDDVDDYDQWSSSPPRQRDGSALAGLTGWTRSVTVTWTQPSAPDQASATDEGVKRITVTASTQGGAVASLTAYRSQTWTTP